MNVILNLITENYDFLIHYYRTSRYDIFLSCLSFHLILIRVYFGGTPQFLWSFMSPYLPLFIAFLRKNFRKFWKFGVLCPAVFFEKFPKISRKFPAIFSTFSKSKKYYFPLNFKKRSFFCKFVNRNAIKRGR